VDPFTIHVLGALRDEDAGGLGVVYIGVVIWMLKNTLQSRRDYDSIVPVGKATGQFGLFGNHGRSLTLTLGPFYCARSPQTTQRSRLSKTAISEAMPLVSRVCGALRILWLRHSAGAGPPLTL